MYLLAWSPVGGVSGAEWIFVGLGVALDLATYSAKPAQSRFANHLSSDRSRSQTREWPTPKRQRTSCTSELSRPGSASGGCDSYQAA